MADNADNRDDLAIKAVASKTDATDVSELLTYTEDGTRRRLDVSSRPSTPSVPSDRPSPCIMNGYKVEYDDTGWTATNTYQTLFTKTNKGIISGIAVKTQSGDCFLKLTVDSVVLWELSFSQISDSQDTGGNGGHGSMSLGQFKVNVQNKIFWQPPAGCFIPYDTSFKLEYKRDAANDKTINSYLLTYTEET